MPSLKDPNLVVQPGPGLLPTGVVPASALLFIPGAGADAALAAHIHNPVDAHMAHAIGVDPFYPWQATPPTPDPILTSVGGPVDGENVLDFIDEFKDLIPPHPNFIGFDNATNITNGIPAWGRLDPLGVGTGTGVTGGYASGTNVAWSHWLVPNGSSTFLISGILYPADRGVLALYKNTDGNFLNPGATTLVAAIYLGDTTFPPPPVGIPHPPAGFDETVRHTQQVNYTASGVGLDQISLTFRYPYLKDYTGYASPPVPYGPFPNNFFRFQLANFAIAAQAVSAGDAHSWLLVHWNPNFATTLARIQPVNLTLPNLTPLNCYSAVPSSNTSYGSGSWDDNTIPVFNVNRHFVFLDTNSAVAPVGTVFTTSPAGTVTTRFLSGIQYYNSTGLEWNVDVRATSLFANSFETGSVDSPPNVPLQFHSAFDPIQVDFTNFGGVIFPVPYYAMNKFGGGAYSFSNSPAPGDTAEYSNATLAIASPAPFCPVGGSSQLTMDLRTPFNETVFVDTKRYLFDTYTDGALSTTTFEPFVDEFYRYLTTFDPTPSATVPIVPAGPNVYLSSSALVATGPDLQVVGQEVVYPQTNYNVATFLPLQATNYSGFPAGDGVDHLRRYQRAVDTGVARNTGWIRLRGLAQAAFTTNAPYDGTETTGHLAGGAIIQLKVPGASGTGWLDLGRAYGDPGVATFDFYGCSTGVIISGPDIYVSFNTTAFTSANGFGNFLLFVRVNFINGPGTALVLYQFQWYPPTFVPP